MYLTASSYDDDESLKTDFLRNIFAAPFGEFVHLFVKFCCVGLVF
jgi:hypothetical protein